VSRLWRFVELAARGPGLNSWRVRLEPLAIARTRQAAGYSPGLGHRRSASRITTSTSAPSPTWVMASSTAARAIPFFQPSLTRASRGWDRVVTRSNRDAAASGPVGYRFGAGS
jgi:hypothetical protein